MENLYQLYKKLNCKKDFISTLIADIDSQYYLKVKPKIKFGDYQREYNAIRLRLLNPSTQITEFIKDREIAFTTFLDDLTFSSNKDFRDLISSIISIIKANHFFPNYKKIHYQQDRCEVTGLIVRSSELKIPAKMLRAARKDEGVNAYVQNVRAIYRQYRQYCDLPARSASVCDILFIR